MEWSWYGPAIVVGIVVLHFYGKRLEAYEIEQYKRLRQKQCAGEFLTTSEQGQFLSLQKSSSIEKFRVQEVMRGEA